MATRIPDYARIAALSSDGYFHASDDLAITAANHGFAALVGLSPDELEASPRTLVDFTHPDSIDALDGLIEHLTSGKHDSGSAVLRLVRSADDTVWVELFAVSRRNEAGRLVGIDGVARDVSQHLEVADLLSRVSLEQRVLLEAQRELLTSLDFDETLHSIVERAHDLLDARIGVLFLLDGAGLLTPTATAPEDVESALIEACRIGEGVIGNAVQDGEPRYVPNVSEPGKTSPLRDIAGGQGSMLVAPLQISTAATGALAVVGESGQYHEEDLDFLVALSQIASLAIINSETHRAVEELATIDPLTGAFNRRFLEQNLVAELSRAQRIGYPLGGLMMDVDELKVVNDRYGHTIGDDVLRHVVDVCRTELRETDWVVRYGGDEFFLVLPGCEQSGLRRIGEKLWSALGRQPIGLEGGEQILVNVSMGGAVSLGAEGSPDALIEAADKAERASKKAGANQLYVYTLSDSEGFVAVPSAQEGGDG